MSCKAVQTSFISYISVTVSVTEMTAVRRSQNHKEEQNTVKWGQWIMAFTCIEVYQVERTPKHLTLHLIKQVKFPDSRGIVMG